MHHVYSIPGFKITELNEVFVHRHSATPAAWEPERRQPLKIVRMEVDLGLFSDPGDEEIQTWILRQPTGLYVSCTCGAQERKLCTHQTSALLEICRRAELRVFFDAGLRREKLRQFALPFGLQEEEDLDRYFRMTFTQGKSLVHPASPHLVPIGKDPVLELSDSPPRREGAGTSAGRALVVIFKPHKYYKHLTVELAEAPMAQNGKPKNPLDRVPALDKVWNAETPAESKFFSALHFLQHKTTGEQHHQSIQALKAILKNPRALSFYEQDPKRSGNLTAASLRPFQVRQALNDLRLRVSRDNPFYGITAELHVEGKEYPLEEARVLHTYFIEVAGSVYLIGNVKLLEVIALMKKHGDRLLIHQSRYDAFREEVLVRLEESTPVDYAYLPAATTEQLREYRFDQEPERFLYLSDAGDYVELCPVMKYGDMEVAILGKKQIYHQGVKTGFRVKRDVDAEIAFTSLIMRQHPYFHEQIEEQLPYFYLHRKHFLDDDWFLDAFDDWQQRGIRIFGFDKLRNNRLNPHKAKITVRFLSGNDWFNAELDVRFGSRRVSLSQIHQAVRNKSRYLRLDDGTRGVLPEEWLERFRDYFSMGEIQRDQIRFPKASYRAVGELIGRDAPEQSISSELAVLEAEMKGMQADLERLEAGLQELETLAEPDIPPELNARLRTYQKQGVSWLNFLDDHRFGGCLADDMGLGKTVQIIAFILLLRKKRPSMTHLLVVPTSLVFSWLHELKKFAPSIRVLTHYGPDRAGNTRKFAEYELIITTYGTLLSDIGFLKRFSFDYVFADESQHIKNPDSLRHQAACLLRARNRIAITGTPLENNTFDLYGQLGFACPGLLGNRQYFREVYALPIDQFGDRKRAAELQQKIRPFILRRTKQQVADELPEKTEIVLRCSMHPAQQRLYDLVEREFREYICSKTNEELPKSSVHILKGLTRLRQVCNAPLLLNDEEVHVKESGKMDLLLEQLTDKAPRHKILVFSQFVSMLNLVRKELDQRGIGYSYLTGATRDRGRVVSAFQSEPEKRIFLISLKAGGTGLNLTQADYVYLIDPWWNPAVENQAIDRVYRIGQKKHVVAVRLICEGSIEEKIMQLQESKKELFDKLISKDSLLKLLQAGSGR